MRPCSVCDSLPEYEDGPRMIKRPFSPPASDLLLSIMNEAPGSFTLDITITDTKYQRMFWLVTIAYCMTSLTLFISRSHHWNLFFYLYTTHIITSLYYSINIQMNISNSTRAVIQRPHLLLSLLRHFFPIIISAIFIVATSKSFCVHSYILTRNNYGI